MRLEAHPIDNVWTTNLLKKVISYEKGNYRRFHSDIRMVLISQFYEQFSQNDQH